VTPTPGRADEDLATLAAGGDDRAYAELVRRHQDGVYRLLRRYLGSADEAYEATHEAFVAAWRALPRYDPARAFGPWLRTIAINKARDRGRRLSVRRLFFGARSLEESGALESADPTPRSDENLILRERLIELDRAVAALPPKLKEALLLTAIEGLSQQEAGATLGVSAKTIETRAYRARKLLARTLAAD
jgi:RNA polymerase sigma-70 factor (ECF subfamily)